MAWYDTPEPGSYNEWWTDIVGAFRSVAIDDHLADGENLDRLNDHITGPVSSDSLASQYQYPVIWSVPQSHTPAYDTVSTEHGDIQVQVVVFATDVEPDAAFQKARALAGRVIDNVEANRSLVIDGTSHGDVFLDSLQMDFQSYPGSPRAQLKFAQMLFSIDINRRYSN